MLFKNSLRKTLALIWSIWPLPSMQDILNVTSALKDNRRIIFKQEEIKEEEKITRKIVEKKKT